MSEEAGLTAATNPPLDSAKSSVLEEEKKTESESGKTDPPIKEPPPIINLGFRGLFSLKSKNMSAKDRFSQKA